MSEWRLLLRPRPAWLLVAVCMTAVGCKKDEKKSAPSRDDVECTSDADCADDNPCTLKRCSLGQCVKSFVAKGGNCENETLCDGVSACDGAGRCVAGPAPQVDDGNACTIDLCHPARGVIHQPVAVDDSDDCTFDACDPRTGTVSHDPVNIDDGDDCTLDSCDPQSGPRHDKAESKYLCGDCGEGFHAASRRPSAQCGDGKALQSFCVPNCGSSFYTCDASCPKGYRTGTTSANAQCGSRTATMTFCLK